MKRFIPFLMLLVASTCSASFSGFTYEQQVTISSTNVSNILGTVNNLPVLFVSTNVVFSTAASVGHMTSNYDLVASSNASCASQYWLNWDTETYNNGVAGSSVTAWVRIPVLSTATSIAATYYWCYGNSGITTYQGISTATWDSNFAGVWHLANGVTLNATDSTVNQLAGTVVGSTAAPNGRVDGAASFVRSKQDHIGYGNVLNLTQSLTVEAWYYQNTNIDSAILSKEDTLSGGNNDSFSLDRPIGDNFRFYINGNIGGNIIRSNTVPSSNTWYRVVASYNSATGTNNIYVNGNVDATPITTGSSITGDAIEFNIGYDSATLTSMDGFLDEVRVSSSVRNSDWIKTDYNNQNSPATFSTVGPEMQASASTSPFISNVRLDFLTHSSVRIRWNTDRLVIFSTITFGQTSNYGYSLENTNEPSFQVASGQQIDMGMALSGLKPNTIYHYAIQSSTNGVNWGPLTADATFQTLSLPVVHPAIPVNSLWNPVFPSTAGYNVVTTALDCHDLNTLIATAVTLQPTNGTVINIPNETVATSPCGPTLAEGQIQIPDDTQILKVLGDSVHISTTTGIFTATLIPPTFNIANGQAVMLSGEALPGSITQGNDNNSYNPAPGAGARQVAGPLTPGVVYYIVNASSPSFQLSASSGGPVIIPGDIGNSGNLGSAMLVLEWPPQNSNWIVIQTSTTDNNFCPQGTRCMGSVWAPKMAQIKSLSGHKNINEANTGFFTHNIWFRGIDLSQDDQTFAATQTVDPEPADNFFIAGYDFGNSNIVFDRSYIHCLPFPNRCLTVLAYFAGANMSVENSDLENWNDWRPTVAPDVLHTGGGGGVHGLKGIVNSPTQFIVSTGTTLLGGANNCSMVTNQSTFTITASGVSGTAYVYVSSSCVLTVVAPLGVSGNCAGSMIDKNSNPQNCLFTTNASPFYVQDSSGGYNCLTMGTINFTAVSTMTSYGDQSTYGLSAFSGEGTQGMQSGVGPGPYSMNNNFWEGTGILWHMDDSSIVDPVNVSIRQNTFAYNQAHKGGSPSWDHLRYVNRNGPECKHCRQVKCDGNTFDGGWSDVSATGPDILFHTAANQGTVGTASTYAVMDIDLTNNTFTNNSTSVEIGSGVMNMTPQGAAARIRIKNNIFANNNGYQQVEGNSNTANNLGTTGNPIELDGAMEDLIIDHNDFYNMSGNGPVLLHAQSNWIEGAQMTNNIMWFNSVNYGFTGEQNGGTVLNPPVTGIQQTFINSMFTNDPATPGIIFAGNLAVPFYGNSQLSGNSGVLDPTTVCTGFGGTYGPPCVGGMWGGLMRTDSTTAQRLAAIQFSSPTANNFKLLYTSPYVSSNSVTTDGKDIGVDMNALLTAQGAVSTPTVSGLTTMKAVISFFTYDPTVACPVDYATSPNDANTQTGGGRASSSAVSSQSITITGLTTKTTYNYRVLCPVQQPTGSFTTK